MRQILPVAGPAEIRQHARRLTMRHPRNLLIALVLHVLAAVSGLAAPRLIGDLVEDVQHGTTAASPCSRSATSRVRGCRRARRRACRRISAGPATGRICLIGGPPLLQSGG